MDLVERSATRLAQYIHRNVEEGTSVAVLKMSLVTVINFVIVAVAVLIICALTGSLKGGLLALVFAPLLRYFSGGIHMKSAQLCNVVSLAIILLAAHMSFSFMYVGLAFNVVAVIILFLYAPQGIDNLSRLSAKYYPVLKFISIAIVATNFYFQSPVLSTAFLLQSITIIPLAQKLVDHFKL